MGNCVGAVFAGVASWREFLAGTVKQVAAADGYGSPVWATDRDGGSAMAEASSTDAADSDTADVIEAASHDTLDSALGHETACISDCIEREESPSTRLEAGGGCSVSRYRSASDGVCAMALLLVIAATLRRTSTMVRAVQSRSNMLQISNA